MENEKDSVRDFKGRGSTSNQSTTTVSLDIAQQGTTPPGSSRSASKRTSTNAVQSLLSPHLLSLFAGLDKLHNATSIQDLREIMTAIYQIKTANEKIAKAVVALEVEIFQYVNPSK